MDALHHVLLGITGLTLVGTAFALWRGGRLGRGALVIFGILGTLWWGEALLTAYLATRTAPPDRAPGWHPRALPAVGGHVAPRDLAAEPDGRPALVFLGDSFTAGQGVVQKDSFARRLEAHFRAARDVQGVIHAVPSWSLWDELVVYGTRTARLSPDVIVWVAVLNDLGMPGDPASGDLITRFQRPPAPSGLHLLDAWRRARLHVALEAQTEATYAAAFAPDWPARRDGFDRLGRLIDAERARGARFLLVIFPLLHDLGAYPFAEAHTAWRTLGEAHGAEVVDLLDVFGGMDASTLWASRADHHPNGLAHEMAADAIRAAIDAGPWPDSGRADCDALPSLPGLAQAQHTACRTGAADDLLAFAEALHGFDPFTGLRPAVAPVANDDVARMLAIVAAHRTDDPELVARAEALVEATTAR